MRLSEQTVTALERVARTCDYVTRGREVLRRQVIEARGAGASWDAIGRMLKTSGEAARKTYGPKLPADRVERADTLF